MADVEAILYITTTPKSQRTILVGKRIGWALGVKEKRSIVRATSRKTWPHVLILAIPSFSAPPANYDLRPPQEVRVRLRKIGHELRYH